MTHQPDEAREEALLLELAQDARFLRHCRNEAPGIANRIDQAIALIAVARASQAQPAQEAIRAWELPDGTVISYKDSSDEIRHRAKPLVYAHPEPPAGWVVIDENGQPCHVAGWPEDCHQHINEAINEYELTEAKNWRVRPYVFADDAAAASPTEEK